MSAFDSESGLQKFVAIIGLFLSVAILGIFLATDSFAVFYFALGTAWLFLLPYHAKLATSIATAAYGSALILPYIPGRPFLWEFAALLGFSGLVITIAMRQHDRKAAETFRRMPWLFIGAALYCLALLVIMKQRGFGFRVLGSEQFGGRFYFQQLTCAIFPLLFTLSPVSERGLVKLLLLQQALAATYLVSDFAFSIAPEELFFLLRFFELSGDALTFEAQAMNLGLRRYQSLYIVGIAGIWLLLYRFRLSYFLSKGFMGPTWLLLGLFALGLMSGHRYLVLISSLTILIAGFAQKLYSPRNITIAALVGILGISFLYAFASSLPLTMQRAASVLPGIDIHSAARTDAEGTFITRRILREIGWTMVPDYLWLGRGFGHDSNDYSLSWDPTAITLHVNQGRFYNGFIGLLINTGLPGTIAMFLFLGSGTMLALRILRTIRQQGCDDMFLRMCSVLGSLWMANLVAFLFLHGDSEYALKTFALQAGVLIACERNLIARAKAAEAVQAEEAAAQAAAAEEESEEATVAPPRLSPGFSL